MELKNFVLSDFEMLINKLIDLKPDLTRTVIEEKIKQKKDKIGAGYLTDQGALFLIAADLGVTLAEPPKIEMSLKDLYVGAKEVSLQTRILSVSPSKQFTRKDGSPFFLRTLTVYDKDGTASVKLWNEKANLPGIEQLKPGDMIKIIKAYVKSDLTGAPTINIGSGSNIEPTQEKGNIPTIEDITKDISSLVENQKDLVVSGILNGPVNSMEFSNRNGEKNTALRFQLKGKDGDVKRVVLWGKNETDIPNVIPSGAKVKLLGVKTKVGNQGIEVHGNDSTLIQIEGEKEIEPIIIRVISKVKSDSGNMLILGTDKKNHLVKISDTANITNQFSDGQILEIMPSKAYGDSIILDTSSFVRKIEDDFSIPTRTNIRTKISDVKVDGNYCIDAIILKITERHEVQTKNGEMISLSEMFVEDDSGQIWVKGWRNQSRLIEKCSIGEIVSITGVNAKSGLEGRIDLFLTQFSSIDKKN